ncbi:DUF4350 domain-containing protein [Mastigocoleus testarum]|uniref:DUF4350 domain-containing protein n=1 Tax=Mastigocoleus testarum BC008 TaxID=371196 RepID=A0A0V7ZIY1_9CYAN|nr:DUF4350 domain-containing protein [Mastigocoleus testarum]KST64332.1 hypothetical protein BC008_17010 [Mastigocoleus testarum BC008]KST64385.1 hypothetical protein BC008_17295 [Mastigocoleus testarum BC008]
MKRSNRLAWFGGIVILAIVILTLFSAPSANKIRQGSTYSRSPDGYGAWYAYMQQQGINIQRWQKPFAQLKQNKVNQPKQKSLKIENLKSEDLNSEDLNSESLTLKEIPTTLLQIYGAVVPSEPNDLERKWVEAGNTLIVLGVRQPPTSANFSTFQKSSQGEIKIETTRRYQSEGRKPTSQKPKEKVQISLGDRFGAIVWEQKFGKGKIIYSTTPYLAANAYQDYQSNYQYLAELVNQKGHKLFVDEYIHGYRDSKQNETKKNSGAAQIWEYLANTPVFPISIQAGVLLLVLVFAQNRRLGKAIFLDKPVVDNSEAYIQALAGVLQKAESANFVVEMVGKQELIQLQKKLGLVTSRSDVNSQIDREELLKAWRNHTGTSDTQLSKILQIYSQYSQSSQDSQKRSIKDKELIDWLNNWEQIKQVLSEKGTGKREQGKEKSFITP